MAGAKIAIGTALTAGEASGDTVGNLRVTLPIVASQSGYDRPLGEVDAGRVTGAALLLAGEISEDYRARIEIDNPLDFERFNYIAQNTSKHIFRSTTMTAAWTNTGFTTNASGITTTTTGLTLLTRQYFPIWGGSQTYAYFSHTFSGTYGVTNKTTDVGFMSPAITMPYAPTDGVYIRFNSTGVFGVMNNNGAEVSTGVFKAVFGGANFTPVVGTVYDFIITAGENAVVFWCNQRDGNGYTQMARMEDPAGNGTPIAAQTLQFGIRDVNTGTTSAVMGSRLVSYAIIQGGFSMGKSWAEIAAGMGATGAQGQSGQTQGSTALYTNSLAAGAGAALTNTTALITGLGGQGSVLPTLAVGTDGILCSYLNPVPTTSISGKPIIVTGVRIQSAVTTVLAGNASPVIYAYALCFGHDALSLATAEGPAAKAPRRIPLGYETFAAAAALGSLGSAGVYVPFTSPISINPGEYVAISAKNIGAVTATGVVTFLVTLITHEAA